jgi:hypothetical protein
MDSDDDIVGVILGFFGAHKAAAGLAHSHLATSGPDAASLSLPHNPACGCSSVPKGHKETVNKMR